MKPLLNRNAWLLLAVLLAAALALPSATAVISDCGPGGPVRVNTSDTLAGNIASPGQCIWINASNVVLDCAGFTITYGGNGTDFVFGIGAGFNHSNITIRDCVLRDNTSAGMFNLGINLTKVNNSFIVNNTIFTNGTNNSWGIALSTNASNNTIENNTVITFGSSSQADGIHIRGPNSSFNLVRYNFISVNASNNNGTGGLVTQTVPLTAGIRLENDVRNNTIDSNTVLGVGNRTNTLGIFLNLIAIDNNVTNNQIFVNGTRANAGIRGFGTIIRNNFVNNTVRLDGNDSSNIGIWLTSLVIFNNVSNNTIFTNGTSTNVGIRMESFADNNTVSWNVIQTNGTAGSNFGIHVNNSARGNNITNNIINTGGQTTLNHGIYFVTTVRDNNISDNNITARGATTTNNGIRLEATASHNTVRHNTVFTAGTTDNYGIYLITTTSLNNITANNITATGTNLAVGIRTLTTSNANLIFNNNIVTNGTGTTNYGIQLSTNSNLTAVSGNVIRTHGTIGNAGIRLDTQADNNTIQNNTIIVAGITTGNNGIEVSASRFNNISNNNISANGTAGGAGIFLFAARNNSFANNTITTNGTNSYGIVITRSNDTTFRDTTIKLTGGWINTSNHTFANRFFNTTFDSFGGRMSFANFTIDSFQNFTLQRANVSFNLSYVNSSNLTYLNSTATVTLYNITFVDPTPKIRYGDTSVFVDCPAEICVEQEYLGNNYTFNVSQFSSFAAGEAAVGNLTITKTDSPDPVSAGMQLNYTVNVTNTGNGTAYNVTVNDTYPAGVVFNSAQPTPLTGTNNTWILGNLTANTSVLINITLNVSTDLTNGTVINNTANATFENNSGIYTSVIALQNTTVLAPVFNFSNISVTKTDSPDPVSAGTQLNYTIFVNVTGNGIAFNVTVNDTYPAEVIFSSADPAPLSGTNNTWILGNLTVGTNFSINITLQVRTQVVNGTIINNTVNTTFQNETGQRPSILTSQATTILAPVINFTNITITKTDSPDPVNASSFLNYTIFVNVTGNGTAYNVTVNDTYPNQTIFLTAQPAPLTGTNNTWILGNLTFGTNFSINISLLVTNVSNSLVINNTANADFQNETDQARVNRSATQSTTVLAPLVFNVTNITVTKTDSPDPVNMSAFLNYTISVNVTGNGTAYNVTVNDTYPNQTIFLTTQPTPLTGTNNTWILGNLTVGTNFSINISLLTTNITNNISINNSVNVTFQNETSQAFQSRNVTINTSVAFTAPGAVINFTNISVTKIDSPDPVLMSSFLNYTIFVNVTAEGTAFNVTVNDTYPNQTIFLTSSPAPLTGTNNTWILGNLSPGTNFSINISLIPTNVTNNISINNSVNVTFQNETSQAFQSRNFTINTTVFVPPPILNSTNITITKTDSPDPVLMSTFLNYTIFVNVTGNGTAFNVTVNDTYPNQTIFLTSSPSPLTGTNNTWILGNLTAGTNFSINISLLVTNVSNNLTINNSVNATFQNETSQAFQSRNVTINTSVTLAQPVINFTNITVTKVDTPDPVQASTLLNYTIFVNVTGNATAYNVTVNDTYPNQTAFISASPTPLTGTNNTWILGNLTVGTNFSINITLLVNNVTNGTLINNSVNASFQNETSQNRVGRNTTINTTVIKDVQVNFTNVTVTKVDSPDPVLMSTFLNYTIFVNVTGNGTAYNVTVNDTYPNQTIFLTSSPAPLTGTNNTWILGNLTTGTNFSINITLLATNVSNNLTINNSVNATFQNETSQAFQSRNTTINTSVTLAQPAINFTNITVTKTDSPDPVLMSTFLNYTILVNVTGNGTAYNVTVNDTYPNQTIFLSAQPTPLTGTNNTWILGNLTAGTNFSINISLLTANVTQNITINNSVNATFQNETSQAFQSRNTTINTTLLVVIPPFNVTNVSITKVDSPDPVDMSSFLSYTLFVNVTGNGTAYNVTVNDTYPAHVIFLNSSPQPLTGTNNTWILGNLTAGTNFSINISLLADNVSNNILINNTANASFQNETSQALVNRSAAQSTTIRTPPVFNVTNLTVTKTDSPDPVNASSFLNYTIFVNITGNATAYNVTVNDTYSNQTIFLTSSPTPLTGTNNTWILGNLTAGTNFSINISLLTTNISNNITINNSVNVTFQNESSQAFQSRNTTINTSVLAVIPPLVFNVTNMTVTKTDRPDPVNMSSFLNYTIFVNVTGNGTAYNVTVNDTYPNQTIFLTAQPTPLTGTNNTWILGNLTVGTNFSINISLLVTNVSNNLTINNSVNATFQNETSQTFVGRNTTINTTVFVVLTPPVTNFTNLSATKIDSPDPVNMSSFLNYTIFVNITGNGTAFNITVNDTYPNQTIFLTAQPTPLTGTNNTFVLGNLTPGTRFAINISLLATNVTNNLTINNSVNVTFQNETSQAFQSRNATINTSVLFVATPPVLNLSNISVIKTDAPDPVNAGTQLNYTINVTSNGNGTAINVTVNDTYPAGVVFNSAQPAPLAGTNNTFLLGNLSAGASVLINVTVNVSSMLSNGTTLTNTVNATFQNETGGALSRVATQTTTVLAPVFNISNISLTKNDAPDPVEVSTQLNYTINVTSNSNGTAFNVTVNDTYPTQIIFLSASPAPLTGTNNTFIAGNLTAGTLFQINISVLVNNVTNGTVIGNSVNASFQNESGTVQSRLASQSTTARNPVILNMSNVTVTKTDTPDPVAVPALLNYTISVASAGDGIAFNVTVNDTYPAQVIFLSAQPAPLAGTNNTFLLGSLAPGTNISINITFNVTSVPNGTLINNTVNATFQNGSNGTYSAVDTESTLVLNEPVFNLSNISVSKSDSPDPVENGTQLNYTIIVRSTGNATAFNVTVNDTYPTQVIFLSASPAPLTGTNNTWILGNLTPGTNISINITVNVSNETLNGTVINNTVNATFQTETGVVQGAADTESTTVQNATFAPPPPPPPPAAGGAGGGGGGSSSRKAPAKTQQRTPLPRTEQPLVLPPLPELEPELPPEETVQPPEEREPLPTAETVRHVERARAQKKSSPWLAFIIALFLAAAVLGLLISPPGQHTLQKGVDGVSAYFTKARHDAHDMRQDFVRLERSGFRTAQRAEGRLAHAVVRTVRDEKDTVLHGIRKLERAAIEKEQRLVHGAIDHIKALAEGTAQKKDALIEDLTRLERAGFRTVKRTEERAVHAVVHKAAEEKEALFSKAAAIRHAIVDKKDAFLSSVTKLEDKAVKTEQRLVQETVDRAKALEDSAAEKKNALLDDIKRLEQAGLRVIRHTEERVVHAVERKASEEKDALLGGIKQLEKKAVSAERQLVQSGIDRAKALAEKTVEKKNALLDDIRRLEQAGLRVAHHTKEQVVRAVERAVDREKKAVLGEIEHVKRGGIALEQRAITSVRDAVTALTVQVRQDKEALVAEIRRLENKGIELEHQTVRAVLNRVHALVSKAEQERDAFLAALKRLEEQGLTLEHKAVQNVRDRANALALKAREDKEALTREIKLLEHKGMQLERKVITDADRDVQKLIAEAQQKRDAFLAVIEQLKQQGREAEQEAVQAIRDRINAVALRVHQDKEALVDEIRRLEHEGELLKRHIIRSVLRRAHKIATKAQQERDAFLEAVERVKLEGIELEHKTAQAVRDSADAVKLKAQQEREAFIDTVERVERKGIELEHKAEQAINDQIDAFERKVEEEKKSVLAEIRRLKHEGIMLEHRVVRAIEHRINAIEYKAQQEKDALVREIRRLRHEGVMLEHRTVRAIQHRIDQLVRKAQQEKQALIAELKHLEHEAIMLERRTVREVQHRIDQIVREAEAEKAEFIRELKRLEHEGVMLEHRTVRAIQHRIDQLVRKAQHERDALLADIERLRQEGIEVEHKTVQAVHDRITALVAEARRERHAFVASVQRVERKGQQAEEKAVQKLTDDITAIEIKERKTELKMVEAALSATEALAEKERHKKEALLADIAHLEHGAEDTERFITAPAHMKKRKRILHELKEAYGVVHKAHAPPVRHAPAGRQALLQQLKEVYSGKDNRHNRD